MREHDTERHFIYFRMSKEKFDQLLETIAPHLQHPVTHKYPVSPAERLAVTLHILATGNSQQSVAANYRLGRTTVGKIFRETIPLIWSCLKNKYLPFPTRATWEKNAVEFEALWNFPNCIGAIDGKHIIIKVTMKLKVI